MSRGVHTAVNRCLLHAVTAHALKMLIRYIPFLFFAVNIEVLKLSLYVAHMELLTPQAVQAHGSRCPSLLSESLNNMVYRL